MDFTTIEGLDYYLTPREGIIFEMVKEYKYSSVRAFSGVLAGLLCEVLPEFEGPVVVCPLPTISRHVRERGFDHVGLMCRKMARILGCKSASLLARETNFVQVGKTAEERERQARGAYRALGGRISRVVSAETTVLLVDDVWTTGASMRAAAGALREAGVKNIVCATICAGK